ncbi:DEAD/DEAH box helicase [Candidatus Liberibacter sp.]|uniref:SNF2-related protein n=1 Tax=Candidatus Liberibacter sp. TaxID=34022 RepID=UPI0015F68056|nr:DEAD/DEAH box helicase [Candidatus Liberibacter sp.]MBA5724408.1 DEAD/DEAH box helicase [Candidatus Liberibacter sp.]
MQLELQDHQNRMVDFILENKRCAMWASMGSGKTCSVLFALSYIQLFDPRPALVIAPLRVAKSVWSDEVARWSAFSNMKVSVITGTAKQRAKALQEEATLFVINFENLPWLEKHLGDKWPFSTIVADESTKLKSFRWKRGGKACWALALQAHHTERFIELTGTPSPNGLTDLWGQMWYLDRGKRLGKTFEAFTQKWFITKQVGANAGAVKHSPKENAGKEIEECLKDICLSIDIKDTVNIDEPIRLRVPVVLPPDVQEQYKILLRELICELQGEQVTAFNSASIANKCLQIANGAVYLDEDKNWKEVHDEKIKALQAIQHDAGKAPILVAYHFNMDLERLLKAFPEGRKLDKDPKTIHDWNSGKIPILFAHPASCGHGLNLQHGGNILVFFSLWWDLETHQQMIERLGVTRQRQSGYNRPVYIYSIVAKDTIDELVEVRLKTKASVQDILLTSLKEVS